MFHIAISTMAVRVSSHGGGERLAADAGGPDALEGGAGGPGGGGELAYARWNADVDRTARFLGERLSVGRGDRVAALAMNCVELLDLWFACGKLGAVFQPLNWRLTP